ncbi:hypothetical protein ASG90_20565 [Nocardioides sp. Soil797]|nr:hypothetical protein ASG90_20565 [Nocardioides sp. Soil797]
MITQQRDRSVVRAAAQSHRDGKLLTKELRAGLDVAMSMAFADAQSKVHHQSGALLASGRHGTSVRDDGETWIGYMAWGGASAGSSADAGIYEMALGGEHDWLRDSWAYDEAIEETIDRHIRKHLR